MEWYITKKDSTFNKSSGSAYKEKLDLSGDSIEYGKDVKNTLKREFLEEVGVKLIILNWGLL